MKPSALLFLAGSAAAVKTGRTFAVMRFNGDAIFNGRIDPIVSPGGVSSHVHTVMGSSGFGPSATGESIVAANCTNAKLKGDHSNYWYPRLYFRDPKNGTLEAVPMFYTNAYYFFEATDDDIKAFPVGLSMISGNISLRTPPASGSQILDPAMGTIQPVGITCPRQSYTPPSWPLGSDGTHIGMQDPKNANQGVGFPNQECDGYASPLRTDIHFPSCYNPAAGLTDYKNNMAWPSSENSATGRANCPEGWIHTPHLFIEVYWNTPLFLSRWTPGGATQPFVLSNGDATAYSLHADFMSGWDQDLLQHIIDTCNAGDDGMDKCPGVQDQVSEEKCSVPPFFEEDIDGPFQTLPGGLPITGWEFGDGEAEQVSSSSVSFYPSSAGTSFPSSVASSVSASASPTYKETNVDAIEAFETTSSVTSATTATSSTAAASSTKSVCESKKVHTVWQTVTVSGDVTVSTETVSATPYMRRRRHHRR
ncbi:hypothetical protein TD95_003606 [Thielaviopsis punctulata]|uniref:DUF1996 domain-containing protein n=1 Tax=Thielaviopsis punctulata TaxID=72032 RepID=A0A0F4ZDU0_9PEZI|nr:hypothetical protein TD95_003606 [Thielaviopsis punctulata]